MATTTTKTARHVYVGHRRDQFRDELMAKVTNGDTTARFPTPEPGAELGDKVELHFLGITKTQEPRLQFDCAHDLWLAVGNRNTQLYAVYNAQGQSRKGMVQSFGLSPALTEARRRAIDMGLLGYRIEDAIYSLGQEANSQLSEIQARLREEEIGVLVRQLNRCIDVRGYEAALRHQAGTGLAHDERCLEECAGALDRKGREAKAVARVLKRAQLTNLPVPSEDEVRAVFQRIAKDF